MKATILKWAGAKLITSDREFEDFNDFKNFEIEPNTGVTLCYPEQERKTCPSISGGVLFQVIKTFGNQMMVLYSNRSLSVDHFLFPESMRGTGAEGLIETSRFFKSDQALMLGAAEYFFTFGKMKPDMYWQEIPKRELTAADRAFMLNRINQFGEMLEEHFFEDLNDE